MSTSPPNVAAGRATGDTSRFCGSCGAPRESLAVRFCRQCGTAFAAPAAPAPPRAVPEPAPLEDARGRPVLLVAVLAFLSNGTYTFFWLWKSWRELKRIRQEPSMHPLWHAVSVWLPLYGLFRFHEHFRVLDDLLRRAGAGVRAGAALLTLIFVLVTLVAYSGIAYALSAREAAAPLGVLTLLSVSTAYAYITHRGQVALNAYYRSLAGVEVPVRSQAFEWIFLAIFASTFAYQAAITIERAGPGLVFALGLGAAEALFALAALVAVAVALALVVGFRRA